MVNKKKKNQLSEIPILFKIMGGVLLILIILSIFNVRDKNIHRLKAIQSDIEDARDEAEQARQDAEDARDEAERAMLLNDF